MLLNVRLIEYNGFVFALLAFADRTEHIPGNLTALLVRCTQHFAVELFCFRPLFRNVGSISPLCSTSNVGESDIQSCPLLRNVHHGM